MWRKFKYLWEAFVITVCTAILGVTFPDHLREGCFIVLLGLSLQIIWHKPIREKIRYRLIFKSNMTSYLIVSATGVVLACGYWSASCHLVTWAEMTQKRLAAVPSRNPALEKTNSVNSVPVASNDPTENELRTTRKNFSVKSDEYQIKIGTFAFGIAKEDGDVGLFSITDAQTLQTGGPVSADTVIKAHVEEGVLYVDADLYTPGNPAAQLQLRDNEVLNKPNNWSVNSSGNRSMEIVDPLGHPFFQIEYLDDSTAVLHGIFANAKGVLVADDISFGMSPNIHTQLITLKPLFKYPTSRYPGVYLDDKYSSPEPPSNPSR